MFNSQIMDLSNVISVNRVRIVNIDLATFDLVFLPNPSLKSTFVQNKSCRSSLPLQLLFWPNFKFLYQSLSFGRSNASKNRSKFIELHYFAPVLATVSPRRPCRRLWPSARLVHASAVATIDRRASPSLSSLGAVSVFPPLHPLPRAHAEPRRAELAAGVPPAKPATPASIQRALASVASPRSYAAPSRARSSSFPAVSALRRRGHH